MQRIYKNKTHSPQALTRHISTRKAAGSCRRLLPGAHSSLSLAWPTVQQLACSQAGLVLEERKFRSKQPAPFPPNQLPPASSPQVQLAQTVQERRRRHSLGLLCACCRCAGGAEHAPLRRKKQGQQAAPAVHVCMCVCVCKAGSIVRLGAATSHTASRSADQGPDAQHCSISLLFFSLLPFDCSAQHKHHMTAQLATHPNINTPHHTTPHHPSHPPPVW
jgi:hypothetical protein